MKLLDRLKEQLNRAANGYERNLIIETIEGVEREMKWQYVVDFNSRDSVIHYLKTVPFFKDAYIEGTSDEQLKEWAEECLQEKCYKDWDRQQYLKDEFDAGME
jgi:hypothetical protein